MKTQHKKLNQIFTSHAVKSTLVILLLFMISCNKDDKLKLNDIDGRWADNNWQYGFSPTETDTLIWVFNSGEKNAILEVVPTNAFGFAVNDIAIRSIKRKNGTSLKAEGLIKYSGSDNEDWVELLIEKVGVDSISLKYDCPSCVNNELYILTRQ